MDLIHIETVDGTEQCSDCGNKELSDRFIVIVPHGITPEEQLAALKKDVDAAIANGDRIDTIAIWDATSCSECGELLETA